MEQVNILLSEKDLRAFLKKISAIQKAYIKNTLENGSRFTPFRKSNSGSEVGIKIDENMASAILGLLFDPRENHGQGAHFLQKFMNALNLPDGEQLDCETCATDLEHVTWQDKRQRRIDLALEFENALIGIENKLGADDGDDQLTAYMNWLTYHSAGKDYYLVYLTPDGDKPGKRSWNPELLIDKTAIDRLVCFSWKKLVKILLNSATDLPEKVKIFVMDFCCAIQLQKLGTGKMGNDSCVKDYLASQKISLKELEAAQAIYNSYPAAVEEIIENWVKRLAAALPEALPDNGIERRIIMQKKEYADDLAYFRVNYPAKKASVLFACQKKPFADMKKNDLMFYVTLWDGQKTVIDGDDGDAWTKHLMKNFHSDKFYGNIIYHERIKNKYSPIFLKDICREVSPGNPDQIPYFNHLLDICQRLEDYILAFDRGER